MHLQNKNKVITIVIGRPNFEGGNKNADRNPSRRRRPIQPGKTVLETLFTAYLPPGPLKVRDAMRYLERDGWSCKRARGSHRQFHHQRKPGTVTIPGHPRDDLPKGTWNSIQKQAGFRLYGHVEYVR